MILNETERNNALAKIQNHIVTAHCAVHDVKMDGSHYLRVKDSIDAIYKLMQKHGPLATWLPDNCVLDKETAKQLSELHTEDTESDHFRADNILCELLKKLGFNSTVVAYRKIEKWFA